MLGPMHPLAEAIWLKHQYGTEPFKLLMEASNLTTPDQRYRVSVTLDPDCGWFAWSDLSKQSPCHQVTVMKGVGNG